MICKDLRRLEKYLKMLKRDFKRYQTTLKTILRQSWEKEKVNCKDSLRELKMHLVYKGANKATQISGFHSSVG